MRAILTLLWLLVSGAGYAQTGNQISMQSFINTNTVILKNGRSVMVSSQLEKHATITEGNSQIVYLNDTMMIDGVRHIYDVASAPGRESSLYFFTGLSEGTLYCGQLSRSLLREGSKWKTDTTDGDATHRVTFEVVSATDNITTVQVTDMVTSFSENNVPI